METPNEAEKFYRIKPLEWDDEEDWTLARGLAVTYEIYREEDGQHTICIDKDGDKSRSGGFRSTLDKAKNACNLHHARRIEEWLIDNTHEEPQA